ncbi:maltokinase N-terminal cap-like domain-containing protein [Kineococcus esterisolvens]|uniref:maltokinase N-terminal cap-like domain-containing protein n=1 Tax=unclassified Kineococcus TaxID=2621656 RepID=UPI003D7ED9B5
MAVIHQAHLVPTKLELIARWLPSQPWCPEGAGEPGAVGAYRFDDPDGEVGLEAHLVRVAGVLVHVPLAYRGAEQPGAADRLVGTMEHSVLGRRWVYDAGGDPVFARVLTDVLAGRARQAVLVDPAGAPLPAPLVRVAAGEPGTGPLAGQVTTAAVGGARVGVVRVLDGTAAAPAGASTLVGTWPGQEGPALLAWTAPTPARTA